MAQLLEEVRGLRSTVSQLKEELKASKRHSKIIIGIDNLKRRLTKEDWKILPQRIILVRHGQSKGNTDACTYSQIPDNLVSLTAKGKDQALEAGKKLHELMLKVHGGREDFQMYFLTSPYCRTLQTTQLITEAFNMGQVAGVRQAVQLREQDFGNFQDPERMPQDMSDRMRFGRFWYRFHGGESGADVYDRLTIFEDHLTRDMMNGRFQDKSLVMVTHGLTMRVFLMRWFQWTVDEFLQVWNPRNAVPIVIEKLPWEEVSRLQKSKYVHVKHVYHVSEDQLEIGSGALRGVTPQMVSYPKRTWLSYASGGPALTCEGCEPLVSGAVSDVAEDHLAAASAAAAAGGPLQSGGDLLHWEKQWAKWGRSQWEQQWDTPRSGDEPPSDELRHPGDGDGSGDENEGTDDGAIAIAQEAADRPFLLKRAVRDVASLWSVDSGDSNDNEDGSGSDHDGTITWTSSKEQPSYVSKFAGGVAVGSSLAPTAATASITEPLRPVAQEAGLTNAAAATAAAAVSVADSIATSSSRSAPLPAYVARLAAGGTGDATTSTAASSVGGSGAGVEQAQASTSNRSKQPPASRSDGDSGEWGGTRSENDDDYDRGTDADRGTVQDGSGSGSDGR